MEINGRKIGPDEPAYLIAEAGSNHDGNLDQARDLIQLAAMAGADAIKFQFFRADSMVLPDHPDYATYKGNELPEWWLPELKNMADGAHITLFYSVFDPADVALLEQYDPPAYKIASAEMLYEDLLKAVAKTGKPFFVSTGMANGPECSRLRIRSDMKPMLLHCVSAYPAPPAEMNLDVVQFFEGLSDHSEDPFAAPLMAVAYGAYVIEKHFTLDRSLPGPDHKFAIEPYELEQLARALHVAHLMRGDGIKRVMPSEVPNLPDRRRQHTDGRWLRGLGNPA